MREHAEQRNTTRHQHASTPILGDNDVQIDDRLLLLFYWPFIGQVWRVDHWPFVYTHWILLQYIEIAAWSS